MNDRKKKFHAVFNITKGTVNVYEDVGTENILLKHRAFREDHDISDTSNMEIEIEKSILEGMEWAHGLDFGKDLSDISMYWIISPSF